MNELLALLSYRAATHRIYDHVRERLDEGDPKGAHDLWREQRDALWRTHPASPVPEAHRDDWKGIPYWEYDPSYAFEVPFDATAPLEGRDDPGDDVVTLPGHLAPWGKAVPAAVLPTPKGDLFAAWMIHYGGGLFVAFRDATNGFTTYGGGRYLIDSCKGSFLGMRDGHLRLDLNFAYHPSCARSPEWNCPLALDPPLEAVRAGEQLEIPAWDLPP